MCVYLCIRIFRPVWCVRAAMRVSKNIYSYLYLRMYMYIHRVACAYAYAYVYVYACRHICMYICIHIYVYVYMQYPSEELSQWPTSAIASGFMELEAALSRTAPLPEATGGTNPKKLESKNNVPCRSRLGGAAPTCGGWALLTTCVLPEDSASRLEDLKSSLCKGSLLLRCLLK